MALTRDALRAGLIQEMLRGGDGPVPILTEEELRRSREAFMAARPDDPSADVWLFGYGSLIWNPAFLFEERRVALLRGHHRRFCLWTHLGRGTAERPGLVLGLEEGGACQGVAFRVAAGAVEEEFGLVWRREMVTGAYVPTWVTVTTARGALRAATFVINRAHPRYAPNLSDERAAAAIAAASGPLGACADYLFNTVGHLEDLGIDDAVLRRLRARVTALRAATDGAPTP